jgi:gentisate 1,2-dioxygenase
MVPTYIFLKIEMQRNRHRFEREEVEATFQVLIEEVRRLRKQKASVIEAKPLVTALGKLSHRTSGPAPHPERWSWASILRFISERERIFADADHEPD